MANGYCATHDKVFPESHYCEACGSESREVKVAPLAFSEYCATHDKTYPRGGACMGCDPSIIEAQNYEAANPVPPTPKYTHCAEHDQVFVGSTCPAGHEVGAAVADPVVDPVAN